MSGTIKTDIRNLETMRTASHLLPDPGGEAVRFCLDEIERQGKLLAEAEQVCRAFIANPKPTLTGAGLIEAKAPFRELVVKLGEVPEAREFEFPEKEDGGA